MLTLSFFLSSFLLVSLVVSVFNIFFGPCSRCHSWRSAYYLLIIPYSTIPIPVNNKYHTLRILRWLKLIDTVIVLKLNCREMGFGHGHKCSHPGVKPEAGCPLAMGSVIPPLGGGLLPPILHTHSPRIYQRHELHKRHGNCVLRALRNHLPTKSPKIHT